MHFVVSKEKFLTKSASFEKNSYLYRVKLFIVVNKKRHTND